MADDLKNAYSADDIQQMLNGEASKKLILSALEILLTRSNGRAPTIKRTGKNDNYLFAISIEGIYEVEGSLSRRNSISTFLQTIQMQTWKKLQVLRVYFLVLLKDSILRNGIPSK